MHEADTPVRIGAATARVGGVRTPPTFGIGTLDPPNFWDFNMGPSMGPPHGTVMGPPQNFWTPLWDPADGTPLKLLTEKIKNRAGKLYQLPPLEFTNLIDYPPSKSGRKTPSTTPSLEFTNLIDYPPPPPLEIGPENSINYPPPLEFTNLIDYPPPSKSGRKTPSTTPPSNSPRNRFGPPQLLKRGGAPACTSFKKT